METMILPLDKKGRHYKDYYDGKKRKRTLSTETTDKYLKLLIQLITH